MLAASELIEIPRDKLKDTSPDLLICEFLNSLDPRSSRRVLRSDLPENDSKTAIDEGEEGLPQSKVGLSSWERRSRPWSSQCSMAATAKHELRQKFSSEAAVAAAASSVSSSSSSSLSSAVSSSSSSSATVNGDEDIAAIAKQISDHAEAIYQTWKSRGLAPTEILNCHSNASAVDKFGSALTPTLSNSNGKISITTNNKTHSSTSTYARYSSTNGNKTSTVDLLAQDNNNLEKFVQNFVVEDKARIAAATGQRSPNAAKSLPSSIQFALQKFERNAAVVQQGDLQSPKTQTPRPTSFVKTQLTKNPQGSQHLSEVFVETHPESDVKQQKIRSPTSDGQPISPSVGGWPLKNKIVIDSRSPSSVQLKSSIIESTKGNSNNAKNYMDEIAREEERLINALKAGVVLDEDPIEQQQYNSVHQMPKQKPAILHEKPKVEVVKPILVTSNHIGPISPTLVNNVSKVLSPTASNGTGYKSLSSKDDLSSLSTVDFAKARFGQATIQQQKVDDLQTKTNNNNNEPLVLTTRTKFESLVNNISSPSQQEKPVKKEARDVISQEPIVSKIKEPKKELAKDLSDKDAVVVSKDGTHVKSEKDFIASRWGLRLNSSKERPRLEQVPHPELTTQQKQHIRAAAATGTGNNPVRPFLTRGSVAERVLIFEKCPSELLLDKRGPRQPSPLASNNWRTNQEKNKILQVRSLC